MITFDMCVLGSGISPIKALIESGQLEADKRADVRLYYGTRDAGSATAQAHTHGHQHWRAQPMDASCSDAY
jgi:hypothetical protein